MLVQQAYYSQNPLLSIDVIEFLLLPSPKYKTFDSRNYFWSFLYNVQSKGQLHFIILIIFIQHPLPPAPLVPPTMSFSQFHVLEIQKPDINNQ